jgi:DNA-binding NtrC family response regulator
MASDILIVDDEEDIRELVSGILDDEWLAGSRDCRAEGEGERGIAAARPRLR